MFGQGNEHVTTLSDNKPNVALHSVLAIVVPLVLACVFVILSPISPFALDKTFFAYLSGEFLYCNTAVLWFGWRLGGETHHAEQLPQRFWISAIVIFLITLMLYQYASVNATCPWGMAQCTSGEAYSTLARYFSYYLEYVVLAYLIIFLGHIKIGVHKV